MSWAEKVLIALDAGVNRVLGGYADMTISARAYTGRADGKRGWKLLADALDRIQPNHCYNALVSDIDRALAAARDLSRYLQ